MKVSEEPGAKIGAPQDTAQVPSEIQIGKRSDIIWHKYVCTH